MIEVIDVVLLLGLLLVVVATGKIMNYLDKKHEKGGE